MTMLHLEKQKAKYPGSLTGCGLAKKLVAERFVFQSDVRLNETECVRWSIRGRRKKGMMERDEEQARNISRALSGKEKEWKGECGSGVRQNLNPFNGDKSPSARDPLRHAGRQFVRVYPTYPDISTSRPGVARVANHPPTSLTSLTHLLFLLSHLHSILPFFDFLLIFSLLLFHFFHLSFYSLIYPFSSSFHSSFCSSHFPLSFFFFSPYHFLYSSLHSFSLLSFNRFFYVNSTLSHLSYRSLAKL